MSRYSTLIFLSLVCATAHGQLFTKVVPQNAVGLAYSHNAWIDYDNDGDLDFLVTGAASTNDLRTILYQNAGSDNFIPAPSPFNVFPQYSESEIAFINFNGDDRIDVLLMGRRIGSAETNRTSLLENRSTGFVDVGFLDGYKSADGYGTISAGDVNNDASTDVFLSGSTGYIEGEPIVEASLFLFDNGEFNKVSNFNPLPLYIATSRLADLDNDSDLDLIFCGRNNAPPYQYTNIYFNDGTGNFEKSEIPLTGLQNPSIDLADYDGDHDLDILFTGLDAFNPRTTKLYRNDITTFTEVAVHTDLNRTASGSAKWADYDNDGDFDILITGDGHHSTLVVFEQADGQFTELEDVAFDTLGIGHASWGDYDGDGDLDILATGSEVRGEELLTYLYVLKNGTANKNTAPTPPGNLTWARTAENEYLLSWNATTDDLTNSASLTYNLSVRNVATGAWLQHPFSDVTTGKRSVAEQGNVWLNTSWNLNNLDDGVYEIKVQAIDGGLAASEWSEVKSLYAGTPSGPANLTVGYDSGDLVLEWTDNSINEEYFVIERRLDDGAYTKVDSVSGVTTWREAPSPGKYEYRVYAVNPNAASVFSNSAILVITGTEFTPRNATFFPNPVKDYLTLRLANDYPRKVIVKLLNVTGSVVQQYNVMPDSYGETQLDISTHAPGAYWIELRAAQAGSVQRMKLLKL